MPIFRVKSVKNYTGQKKFTRELSWLSWQIWGMGKIWNWETNIDSTWFCGHGQSVHWIVGPSKGMKLFIFNVRHICKWWKISPSSLKNECQCGRSIPKVCTPSQSMQSYPKSLHFLHKAIFHVNWCKRFISTKEILLCLLYKYPQQWWTILTTFASCLQYIATEVSE